MKHTIAHPQTRTRCRRRGSALVYMTMTLTVSVAFAALSVDLSRFRSAEGDLETLADAAALNAANGLSDNTYVAKANAVAAENKVDNTTASIPASAVVPGYWSGAAFTANGTPCNAVKVTASRTKAAGTAMNSYVARGLGWQSPDLTASSVVALVDQSPYEWAAKNSVSLASSTGGNAMKVASFDATAPGAAQTQATLKSDGSFAVTGPANLNANIKYGTTNSVSNQATVTGSISQLGSSSVYPPGSQVANLNGVTPAYTAMADTTVTSSMTIAGGTYVMKNFTVANCNIVFAGPVTIVATGDCTFSNVGLTTYGNLPANLKLITTTPGATINVTNPTLPMYADIYAPDSTLNYTSAAGFKELRGRGLFGTLNVSGAGASLYYDRSLNSSSQSKKAVVVE